MLTIPFIRANSEITIQGLTKKHVANASEIVHQLIAMDDQRKSLLQQAESALEISNAAAKEIGSLMQSGQKELAEGKRAETAALKGTIKEKEEAAKAAEKQMLDLLVTLPNLPHSSVPEGKTAEENEVVLTWGSLPKMQADAQPHWDLIKKYDIIDFDLGNKITGAGFPVYKGKGARLQRALINFFLDEAIKVGYYEIQPPILINEDSGFGTGQLPDKEGQMYVTKEEGLFLIPTAEVPITNLYRDVIVNEKELPIKNVGHTPCFRREAGSWGAHVRGLNRLHQFDKIEIVQIHKPETSYQALEEMSLHVQGLLQKLNLHYRVLRLCGGDMGFASALTYDMEVWSGAQNRWLEVSSVSNFETFQANRLKLRTKVEGKSILCHTLNGSALALPRIVAALLENNQGPDGIKIPEILVPYTGFTHIN
ncbi:MAG: serine--tRNA ligase [Cytophagia bacterium]|jgi:seryl-tRNA synthetase|nr:serine--tRNA ligase [Cytophagia bacterium]